MDQFTHEIAVLKRLKLSALSEQLDAIEKNLFEGFIEADIAAIEAEFEQLRRTATSDDVPRHPRRAPLPTHRPRTEHRHELASPTCACGCVLKRIGEDVSDKLDYTPGVFTVELHKHGK